MGESNKQSSEFDSYLFYIRCRKYELKIDSLFLDFSALCYFSFTYALVQLTISLTVLLPSFVPTPPYFDKNCL